MEKFMLSLLFCSLEMSAVSLVYMGLLKALKNRQAAVLRYYSWLVILTGFLLPIKPSFVDAAVTIGEPAPAYTAAQATAPSVHSEPSVTPYHIVFIIWLTVALLYLAITLFRYKLFARGIKRLSKQADKRTLHIARQTAGQLGIKAPIKVLIMKEISTPMMTGLTEPVILLPEREFSDSELRLILKHELTHFKHKDLWVKLLFTICHAVHWFDPVMILIGRSIEQECEHYCDHSVIFGESACTKKLYCQSILDTVSAHKRCKESRLHPVMATNFYTPKQGLKHRLSLIVSGKRKKKFALIGVFVAALTAVSGSVVVFASNADVTNNEQPKAAENTVQTAAVTQAPKETTTSVSEHAPAKTTTAKSVTSKTDTAPAETYNESVYAQNEVKKTTTVTAPYFDEDEPVVTTAPAEWNYEYPAETTTVTYIGKLPQ